MPSTLTEVIGTDGNDDFRFDAFVADRTALITNSVTFGGLGDDIFESANFATLAFFEGGAGNDTYIVESTVNTAFISATGGGTDRVIFRGFDLGDFETEVLEVDGRHLALMDTVGQWVIILDYRTAQIGQVELFGQIVDYASTIIGITVDDEVSWQTWISNFVENVNITGDIPALNTTGAELAGLVDRYVGGPDGGGTSGDDDLSAFQNDRDNFQNGRAGNDTLSGGDGNDSLLGEDGGDTLVGGDGDDTLLGGNGNDFLNGQSGMNVLEGGAGDDILVPGDAGSTADGGAGNDTFIVGEDETISGGADDDLIVFLSPRSVNINLEAGTFTSTVLDTDLRGSVTGVEYAIGTSEADTLRGTEEAANILQGREGNDRILGLGGNDALAGEEGSDFLVGGIGADTVTGGAGGDSLFAGAGDIGGDVYIGGDGADIIGTGRGADLAIGDYAINDAIRLSGDVGNSGSDTIFGGNGRDTLVAGGWNDVDASGTFDISEIDVSETLPNIVYAGDGNDEVYGANGDDELGGGPGNDTLYGYGGDDLFYGGKGSGSVNDIMFGGDGTDTLFGASGSDTLSGGDGVDEIFGGAEADSISGGAGGDSLYGGGGDDQISGEGGADIFFFAGNHGADVVTDFSVVEDILFVSNTVLDFTSIADVMASAEETEINEVSGVLISTGEGNNIFLQGVMLADLGDANFVF